MKRISSFLTLNPSYTKWGSSRLAEKTSLSVTTIERFKKSEEFKNIKRNYLKGLK